MYLGVKAVIAMAIERIHAANLINFGIIPFTFANPADYDKIDPADAIRIADLHGAVKAGEGVAVLEKADGSTVEIPVKTKLTDEDKAIILAGGRLNLK